MTRTIACLAACLLWFPSHHARADDPRAAVERVAAVIEREYYDPVRAADIAAALRRDARRGDFDARHEPLELASALTGRLQPHDRHFGVRWSPPDAGGTRTPPPRAPVTDPARDNFGIRRVEVLPGNIGYLQLRYFADFDADAAPAPGDAPARQRRRSPTRWAMRSARRWSAKPLEARPIPGVRSMSAMDSACSSRPARR